MDIKWTPTQWQHCKTRDSKHNTQTHPCTIRLTLQWTMQSLTSCCMRETLLVAFIAQIFRWHQLAWNFFFLQCILHFKIDHPFPQINSHELTTASPASIVPRTFPAKKKTTNRPNRYVLRNIVNRWNCSFLPHITVSKDFVSINLRKTLQLTLLQVYNLSSYETLKTMEFKQKKR